MKTRYIVPKANKSFEQTVLEIAEHWNSHKNFSQIRVLKQSEYNAVVVRLGYFEKADLIDIIDYYSTRQWNVANQSWRTMLSFFLEPSNKKDAKVDMIIKCADEIDLKKHEKVKNQSPSPEIRPLTNEMANSLDPKVIKRKAEEAQIDKVRKNGKLVGILHKAINEINMLCGEHMNPKTVEDLHNKSLQSPDSLLRGNWQVRKQVLTILARTAPTPASDVTDNATPGN